MSGVAAKPMRWWSVMILIGFGAVAGCQLIPFAPVKNAATEKDAPPSLGSQHSFRVSQFVFIPDFEVQRTLPIFNDLAQLREQVYKELKLPPSNAEIYVYLFEDREKYERYMETNYPQLPKRRAFFVAQPRFRGAKDDLMVFTSWGPRIDQDLRHELTHAMLHSVLKNVPLWLDEGLAEFFEVPASWNGVNLAHVEQLRQPQVRFDLERLEKLKEVDQMSPDEYREAWGWTHLMLRSSPKAKQALLSYLQDLRTQPNPGPLRPRLATAFLSIDAALQTHLAELESKAKPTTARR
jgi:hypothetical protein